jgi:PAS domain S-box-containing protein
MASVKKIDSPEDSLRLRASRLIYGTADAASANALVLKAMSALKELSEQPETGALALAFLHELQVHQVELAIQEEDLREDKRELAATLRRQTRLLEHAPVACFAVDGESRITELNRAACRSIGTERHRALDQDFGQFLSPTSRTAWQDMKADARSGLSPLPKRLQLLSHAFGHRVLVAVEADPEGGEFFVALTDLGPPNG